MSDIQDEAYSEAMDEIARLKEEAVERYNQLEQYSRQVADLRAQHSGLKSQLGELVHYIDYFKLFSTGIISYGSDDSTMGKARECLEIAREAVK